MDLASLASRYGNFYAPSFAIRIRGEDVMRDLLLAVSQVEIDLTLGAVSRFNFTVIDSYSHDKGRFLSGRGAEALDLLSFGADVDICVGYGDGKSMPIALKGVVTEITTSFPEGGSPELSVAGYDRGFRMTIGKSSRTWSQKSDSFAANDIASYHNLQSVVEDTREVHQQIEQHQESDWEFLKKLAERNHFEMYVDEKACLHFVAPNYKAEAVAQLGYGGGLLSFKPEANLAGQVARVQVNGWDPQQFKAIVGVAIAGEEIGLKGRSAGQRLSAIVRDDSKLPTLKVRQPVFTEAEAKRRAVAALYERAEKFLTGEGESIGLPEIRPDRKVELTRLGPLFSKTYYVTQATHKIDSSGYRTRFKVKETGL